MATNVKLILDTRRKKKNDTYPLVLRIIHNRKPAPIQTGYSLHEKDWNPKAELVRSSCKLVSSVKRLNNSLQKQKSHAFDVINKLDDAGELQKLSVKLLKERILQDKGVVSSTTKGNTFFNFTQKIIDQLREARKYGSANSYQTTLGVVKGYRDEKDFTFDQMDYAFLKGFEAWHYGKGNTLGGLSFYMRTIRAVYNRAITEGVIPQDWYPFKKYKLQRPKTRKRAIKLEGIEKIENATIEEGTQKWHYRNYFIISFCLRGMNFIDMGFLKMKDIQDGRIRYTRRKTGVEYDIKMTEKVKKLLKPYLKGKSDDDYVFPIIKRPEDPELAYKDVRNATRYYNYGLQEIGKECGLKGHLTAYVARHTYATAMKKMGVDIAIISEALGHTTTRETEVYLDSFEDGTVDDASEKLTG